MQTWNYNEYIRLNPHIDNNNKKHDDTKQTHITTVLVGAWTKIVAPK